MAGDAAPTWLGSAITAAIAVIGAVWAFLRYMFVTRREMESYIEKVESRFEMKVEEIKQVLINLHADNKQARHRLRNDLNSPLMNLATSFESLRQELVRQRQNDVNYRRTREAREERLTRAKPERDEDEEGSAG